MLLKVAGDTKAFVLFAGSFVLCLPGAFLLWSHLYILIRQCNSLYHDSVREKRFIANKKKNLIIGTE